MSFYSSFSEIGELLSQVLDRVFQEILQKRVLGILHQVEAIQTVKLQLELFKHVNPRRDNQESCFRLFNMWREDQEPLPLEIDTLSRYSVPFFDPASDREPALVELSIENVDISILEDSDHPKQTAQATKKVNSNSKKPATRRLTAKAFHNAKNVHLIPLQAADNDPIEIQLLRTQKLNEEAISAQNKLHDRSVQSVVSPSLNKNVNNQTLGNKTGYRTEENTVKQHRSQNAFHKKVGFVQETRPSTAVTKKS